MKIQNKIAWFYLRETRGCAKAPYSETHRFGCVAMFKTDDGKLCVSFSLATKGDRFVRRVGRDIALGKLVASADKPTRAAVVDMPRDCFELIHNHRQLNAALGRRLFNTNAAGTFATDKNNSALAGALKELELVKS